LLSYAL
ncbi:PP-loop family protein, partial [Chlamydia psittaci 06-1683]